MMMMMMMMMVKMMVALASYDYVAAIALFCFVMLSGRMSSSYFARHVCWGLQSPKPSGRWPLRAMMKPSWRRPCYAHARRVVRGGKSCKSGGQGGVWPF